MKVYSTESDKIISYCRERQGDRIRNVLTGNHGLTTEKRMGKLPSLQKLYKSITAHFQGEMCLLSIIMFVLHTNKEYPADFWLCRSPSSMLGSQKCLVCPQRERLVGCFSPCTWSSDSVLWITGFVSQAITLFQQHKHSNAVDVSEGSEQGRPRGDGGGPVHAPVGVGPSPGHHLLVAAGVTRASLPPSPAPPAPPGTRVLPSCPK